MAVEYVWTPCDGSSQNGIVATAKPSPHLSFATFEENLLPGAHLSWSVVHRQQYPSVDGLHLEPGPWPLPPQQDCRYVGIDLPTGEPAFPAHAVCYGCQCYDCVAYFSSSGASRPLTHIDLDNSEVGCGASSYWVR